METIKMGKRGTIVLPAKLRKQFGLEDGSLLNVDVVNGKISIVPSYAYESEIWTPARKAYLTLINTSTQEEFDEVSALLREEGIDPAKAQVEGLDPNYRASLPTNREFEASRAARLFERQSA